MDEKILIQSQRLYVRTWKQSDLDALYHVMSEPQTHLYTQQEPWSREYTQFPRDAQRGYLAEQEVRQADSSPP